MFLRQTDRQTEAERHTEIVFERERDRVGKERERERACVWV